MNVRVQYSNGRQLLADLAQKIENLCTFGPTGVRNRSIDSTGRCTRKTTTCGTLFISRVDGRGGDEPVSRHKPIKLLCVRSLARKNAGDSRAWQFAVKSASRESWLSIECSPDGTCTYWKSLAFTAHGFLTIRVSSRRTGAVGCICPPQLPLQNAQRANGIA